MPRLLSAYLVVVFQHFFKHIAVAHLGFKNGNIVFLGKALKAHIGHNRYHSGIVL